MTLLTRREWLGAAVLALGGCAAFSVRPPTPAKDIPEEALDDPEPGSRFFFAIFGSESTPKVPARTHTFGTALKTTATCAGTIEVTHHTISWMPQTLKIRPLSFHPEPGRNLGLVETVEWALADGQRVVQWGPYEVRPRAFRRFLIQKEFLESGAVGYQCIDTIGEAACRGNGCDCIHALTDMDPKHSRGTYPLANYGVAGSRWVVRQVWRADLVLDGGRAHKELNGPLGLDGYPIEERTYSA